MRDVELAYWVKTEGILWLHRDSRNRRVNKDIFPPGRRCLCLRCPLSDLAFQSLRSMKTLPGSRDAPPFTTGVNPLDAIH